MSNEIAVFDPVLSLVATNLTGRDATLEEATIIDAAWVSAESSIRAMAWLSREGKTWKHLIAKNDEPFTSFEQYGKERFGYEKAYLSQLCSAYETQKSLKFAIANKEMPETHLRELGKVKDIDLRSQIYAEVTAENEEVTAKLIREKAEALSQAIKTNFDLQDKLNEQKDLFYSEQRKANQAVKELEEKEQNQASIVQAEIEKERANMQAVIDAKTQLIAKSQQEAENLRREVERTRKEQDSRVQDGVQRAISAKAQELEKMNREIQAQKEEVARLYEVKATLRDEVGDIEQHKTFIKQAQEHLTFIKVSVDLASEINTVDRERAADWETVKLALFSVIEQIEAMTENAGIVQVFPIDVN
jgi:DNA repair exonuclease SbcCD ATPase subunit